MRNSQYVSHSTCLTERPGVAENVACLSENKFRNIAEAWSVAQNLLLQKLREPNC